MPAYSTLPGRRSATALLALAMTLAACSSSSEDEVGAQPKSDAMETDAVESTRATAVGHAEPLVVTTEALPDELAFALDLWAEMGATPEQAVCYAELFESNGWSPETAEDIARIQLDFTPEQSEEFGAC